MTTSSHATYVDVLICPYGSEPSKACKDAVTNGYVGAVMIWGGASDTLFASQTSNVFGFFTVGSKYTTTGLEAVDSLMSGITNVAVITNTNGFSKSVAEGAKATIAAAAGLSLQSETNISVYQAPLTTEDKTNIKAAMDMGPELVVIAGHNQDVEPVIVEISNGATKPRAILATNGLTGLTNFGASLSKANCVMMPTQWDSTVDTADPVVGWTSAIFMAAVGTTYQHAAGGAVGVAIANAMSLASGTFAQKKAKLAQTLRNMDINSFYGRLKWDANGRIEKPMYTQQKQIWKDNVIVAPTGTSNMRAPITGDKCWGSPWTADTSTKLKLGGMLQDSGPGDSGRDALMLWNAWASSQFAVDLPEVDVTCIVSYDSGTLATAVGNMTTSSHATYVDVLICPYGSGPSQACNDAVTNGYAGAVMIWGGASDALFASPTSNVFGFFTVGSHAFCKPNIERVWFFHRGVEVHDDWFGGVG
eukprot:TRINITY_DN1056_c0_g1_i10.p1 TRINITY_DN1056_c0_g1~~TRINITY_DN1056_c0_g1_i10.p1  ORF type:complete len:475 (+),score=79.16 TRINITY_DN1056_c0_g1_i10:388-1812(+)